MGLFHPSLHAAFTPIIIIKKIRRDDAITFRFENFSDNWIIFMKNKILHAVQALKFAYSLTGYFISL